MAGKESFRIGPAISDSGIVEGLADVLIDCVEAAASVGFMHPLARAKAIDFWEGAL